MRPTAALSLWETSAIKIKTPRLFAQTSSPHLPEIRGSSNLPPLNLIP